MKRLIRLLPAMAALCLLSACVEQNRPPSGTATRSKMVLFRSGACDVFPNIDRSPIPAGLPHADAGTPLTQTSAGIQSVFTPGAPPIACDRLTIALVQGLIAFQGSLASGLDPATVNAFLEISAFEPDGTIAMTDTEAWITGWGGVLSSYTNQTADHCRFRVMSVQPAFANRTHSSDWLPSTPLTTGTGRFMAPFGTTQMINVTPEFRRALAGGGFAMGLAIEPDDPTITAKANNRCAGRFSVQLKLLGPD